MTCANCKAELTFLSVYRCFDCDASYCKSCLIEHCKECERLDGLVRAFDQATHDAKIQIQTMYCAYASRFEDRALLELLREATDLIDLCRKEAERMHEDFFRIALKKEADAAKERYEEAVREVER